jgi:hypothetical protein
MTRHARWLTLAPSTTVLLLPFGASGCSSCKATPEPAGADARASASPSPVDASFDKAAWLARHPRDDAGNLIPRSSPPPPDPRDAIPVPKRDPDWDLDPEDPARDYVRVYAIATRRYGETLDCVDLGASRPVADGRRVEARVAASCADAGAMRDVFIADVAADHLRLEDGSTAIPLARWPDGSDPAGPPTRPVRQAAEMSKWKSALHDALTARQLVAIRLQSYGRGSYPVITLAGWHGAVNPQATPEELKPLAVDLCKANTNLPLALFGGLDRSTTLRIRCPATVRWDKL